MSEQQFQTKCINYLEGFGADVTKVVLASKAGAPDLYVCYCGLFVVFETKSPTGKVEPLQKYKLEKIEKAGGLAFVVSSMEQLIEAVEYVKQIVAKISAADVCIE